ncbi:hypothetical protein T190607A01A_30001 [Tenacibaculum sp. 190524A05c]|uniref:Uncharacterized protein n=1 Tax=Tenacibaculum platacis TaxID=3137852 RepID=A0ABM9P1T5_9FLAO
MFIEILVVGFEKKINLKKLQKSFVRLKIVSKFASAFRNEANDHRDFGITNKLISSILMSLQRLS